MQEKFNTKQVADMLGIDKSTLLRWIRQGKIPDVIHRDGRNWRVWLPEDIERVRLYHDKIHQLTLNLDSKDSSEKENGG
jgi:excisionase family DNA binding protein